MAKYLLCNNCGYLNKEREMLVRVKEYSNHKIYEVSECHSCGVDHGFKILNEVSRKLEQ